MNYTLLDELWDDYPSTQQPSKRKSKTKKKKSVKLPEAPSCELYNNRNLPVDTPYAQQQGAPPAKTPPQPNSTINHYKTIHLQDGDQYMISDDEYLLYAADNISKPVVVASEDEGDDTVPAPPPVSGGPSIADLSKIHSELDRLKDMIVDLREHVHNTNEQHGTETLDYVMFFVAGVMMIFIMEQFLQIGIHMQTKNLP